VQQPGRRPFATALAVHLMPGNPVRPGKSEAEAEARLHEVAPGEAVVEGLHVGIDLPAIGLPAALVAIEHADVAVDIQRPAVDPFEEGPTDVHSDDATGIVP